MTTATFPLLVNSIKEVRRIPSYRTVIISYGNKVEQRIAKDSLPRHSFNLQLLDILSDDVIDQILTFFKARKGSFEAFYLQSYDEAYRERIWEASTAYVADDIVRPPTANGRSYRCTIAGTSNSSEPTWPVSVNGTIVDGTVTWTENTYLVRFETDLINIDYFNYRLATIREITMIEVSA